MFKNIRKNLKNKIEVRKKTIKIFLFSCLVGLLLHWLISPEEDTYLYFPYTCTNSETIIIHGFFKWKYISYNNHTFFYFFNDSISRFYSNDSIYFWKSLVPKTATKSIFFLRSRDFLDFFIFENSEIYLKRERFFYPLFGLRLPLLVIKPDILMIPDMHGHWRNIRVSFLWSNFGFANYYYLCLITPEIIAFSLCLVNILLIAYYTIIYRNNIGSLKILNYSKYCRFALKLNKFFNIAIVLTVLAFINPVIWTRITIFIGGVFILHPIICLFKLFYLWLFKQIILVLRIKINSGFIISLETYVLLSGLFFCLLILFSSNSLLITLLFFEIIFFLLLPFLSHSFFIGRLAVFPNLNSEKFMLNQNYYVYLYQKFIGKKKFTYNKIHQQFSETTFFLQKMNYSVFSTIIYLIYNLFFVGLYFFSIILLFIFFNGLSYGSIFNGLHSIHTNSFFFFFVISLLLIIFLFKMAIFPFYGWLIILFENTNYFVLVLINILFKYLVFYTFCRLMGLFAVIKPFLAGIFFLCGSASLILGSIGMYCQLNIRKFLAYSAINHAGYIFIGLTSSVKGALLSSILYLIIYLITMLGLFFSLMFIQNKKTGLVVNYFSELIGAKQCNKFLIFFLSLLLLSLAGIPPLAGFWGKFLIIKSLLALNFIGFLVICIIIITTSISLIGYLRIIKLLLSDDSNFITIFCEFNKKLKRLFAKIIIFLITFGFIFVLGVKKTRLFFYIWLIF